MPLTARLLPDSSGLVFPSTMSLQMSLTNAKSLPVYVWGFPAGADIGFEFSFVLPQNYVGTPLFVIRGIIDGTPANVLAFGVQFVAVADNETTDVAYEAEDLASNSTWTNYADEDMYEETITPTPSAAWSAGKTVLCKIFRDDSVDTTTFDFLLTELALRYNDS